MTDERILLLLQPLGEVRRRTLETDYPHLRIVDCVGAPDRAAEAIVDADYVYGGVPRELFVKARRLALIQVISQGVEGLLYPELVASPVVLANGKGVWSPAMAEHILAFILSFYRQLPRQYRNQLACRWDRALPGLTVLQGKTVGFVGTGDIACHAARLCAAFGTRLRGWSRTGATPLPFEAVQTGAGGLLDVLRASDVVVNTLPWTPDTHHVLGAAQFDAMKPSALFINVGRGRTVDEPALVAALREGRIGGAALDVYEEEPLPEESPLWRMENVIISPHTSGIGGYDEEQAFRILHENLRRALSGEPLLNVIDKRAGY